ncbi:MAG: DUF6746 family protein [Roseovarius sp.]
MPGYLYRLRAGPRAVGAIRGRAGETYFLLPLSGVVETEGTRHAPAHPARSCRRPRARSRGTALPRRRRGRALCRRALETPTEAMENLAIVLERVHLSSEGDNPHALRGATEVYLEMTAPLTA